MHDGDDSFEDNNVSVELQLAAVKVFTLRLMPVLFIMMMSLIWIGFEIRTKTSAGAAPRAAYVNVLTLLQVNVYVYNFSKYSFSSKIRLKQMKELEQHRTHPDHAWNNIEHIRTQGEANKHEQNTLLEMNDLFLSLIIYKKLFQRNN